MLSLWFMLCEKSTGAPPAELKQTIRSHHLPSDAHTHAHKHTCHSCKPHSKKELTVIWFSLPSQRKNINSLKGDEETLVGI